MSFINANCAVIKNINGKISKRIEGIFNNVRKTGIAIDTFRSLKKFISSNIFNMKAKDKNTINVFSNVVVKILLR
tara:strand:+ start:110 stop:334 length:225 start_codon:yes stop_codon:yes gene_type:complete